MEKNDLTAVSGLLCECYRWLGEQGGCTQNQVEFLVSTRGSLDCVTRESETETYLVACRAREVVGVAAVSGNEITKLYVSPACHRQGIGARLLTAAESIIRDSGHGRLMLGAFRSAVPFYRAMGLSVMGRRTCTPAALAGLYMVLMQKRFGDMRERHP
jgi:ribosomal protein S18 acetylase RimI-like enzyme